MPFRQQFEASGLGPCQNLMQSYFAGLDQAALGYEPVMKGVARMQLEMIGLMSRRAQAYLEVPSRLATIRSPQDLFAEQMRFWQTAFQQYSDSSRRVMTTMATLSPVNVYAAACEPKAKPKKRDYLDVSGNKESSSQAGVKEFPSTPRRVA